MQRKLMKNLLLVVAMVVLCLAVGMTASAEKITGFCGENATYLYDSETGIATISGTGSIDKTFLREKKIQSLIIEDGITIIGAQAFKFCDNIKNIYIPKSVQIIEDTAFDASHNIDSFCVSENNPYYSSDEFGALFDKEKTVLIKYPHTSLYEKYTIPHTVKKIEASAFECNTTLLEIIIPDGVEEIGVGAFHNCINLRELVFPGSVKQIPVIAENLIAVSKITIKDGVESISDYGFFFPLMLKDIYIEDMNIQIGEYFLYTEMFVAEESREDFLKFLYDSFWIDQVDIDKILHNDGNYYDAILQSYLKSVIEKPYITTIHCHSGSTAESYAIENGIDYVLTHFYDDGWTYDYDNGIKYKKCIHCDEKEVEELEIENPDEPQVETKDSLFSKVLDWFRTLFNLIMSWFK